MFINLSNHPTAEWSNRQIAAAKMYGAIKDMPFPHVAPDATADVVKQMAEQAAVEILTAYGKDEVVVHIMGEQNFVYAAVNKLRSLQIRCFAATSERNVSYRPTGEKIVSFQFVRFREYK